MRGMKEKEKDGKRWGRTKREGENEKKEKRLKRGGRG